MNIRKPLVSAIIHAVVFVSLLVISIEQSQAQQGDTHRDGHFMKDAFSLSWFARDVREDVSSIGMDQKQYYLLTTQPTPITPKPTPLTLPEWKVYDRHNSGLTLDAVQTLMVDKSHRIWLGTSDGIFVYNGTTWQHFNRSNSPLTSNFISCIAHDNFGRIIVGMKRDFPQPNGIAIFENGIWTSSWLGDDYTTDDRYHNPTSIAVDSIGRIWVATDSRGLWMKDGDNWVVFNEANSDIPSDRLSHIQFDNSQRLWIGTWEGGYSIYNGFVFENFDSENTSIPNNRIAWIELTDKDTTWFSCAFSGVAVKDNDDWTVFPGSQFSYDSFRTIRVDPYRNMHWFATGAGQGEGGAWSYDGTRWVNFTPLNSGIASNNVMDTVVDWNGHVWFATDRGACVYDPLAVENGVLYGTVTDGQTGYPVSGAVLTLSGGIHTTTNQSGDYMFMDLPPDTNWVLYADSEGHLPIREANITIQADTSTRVNLQLDRATLNSLPANWNEPFGETGSIYINEAGGDMGNITHSGTYPVYIDDNFGLDLVSEQSQGRMKDPQHAVDSGAIPQTAVMDMSVYGLHSLNELLSVRVNDFLVPRENIQVVPSRYRWQRIRLTLDMRDNWFYFPAEDGGNGACNQVQLDFRRPALVDWVALDLAAEGILENENFGLLSKKPVEKYFDLDSNWLHELLLLEFELETGLTGECFAQARLVDKNGTGVADGQIWLDLKQGTNKIPLYFPGNQIFESRVDGPYELAWVALYTKDASSVYQVDFETQPYRHDQFESVGVATESTPTPPAFSPTPTSHPDFNGDYEADSIDLFRFGRFWKQPSARAPILDLHPDGWIDEKDLLAFLNGWQRSVEVPNGDFNQDGVTNDLDFFEFVQAWKRSDSSRTDINDDKVVDQKDILLFLEAWHQNYTREVGEPIE